MSVNEIRMILFVKLMHYMELLHALQGAVVSWIKFDHRGCFSGKVQQSGITLPKNASM